MVLLRGLNYDYSGQQSSLIATAPAAAATTLVVENTEGFADDDYLVIAPNTEISEIVKIGAAVSSDTSLTISALKFAHSVNDEVFRLPYNQMKFYECATETGTYVLIASSATEMSYANNYTNYNDTTATADYYYKRTFYNATSDTESLIALSEAWQVDDEDLYATPEELRTYLQYDENDYPTPNDMRFFIKFSMKRIALDLDSSDTDILFIATLLLAKTHVLRGLATRSIRTGYIQVNAEGRTITKAYQEFVLDAENSYQEYKEFILSVGRQEAIATNFMDNTSIVSSWTRQDIIAMMNGTSNALDDQYGYRYNYFWRRRSS